jgi:hypothetical protein
MGRQQAPIPHAHSHQTDSLSSVDCADKQDHGSQPLADFQTLSLVNPAWHPGGLGAAAAYDGPWLEGYCGGVDGRGGDAPKGPVARRQTGVPRTAGSAARRHRAATGVEVRWEGCSRSSERLLMLLPYQAGLHPHLPTGGSHKLVHPPLAVVCAIPMTMLKCPNRTGLLCTQHCSK